MTRPLEPSRVVLLWHTGRSSHLERRSQRELFGPAHVVPWCGRSFRANGRGEELKPGRRIPPGVCPSCLLEARDGGALRER